VLLSDEEETEQLVTKNQLKKQLKKGGAGKKVFFDAEGKPVSALEYHFKKPEEVVEKSGYLESVKERLREADQGDKELAREKLKEKRLKLKRRRKGS